MDDLFREKIRNCAQIAQAIGEVCRNYPMEDAECGVWTAEFGYCASLKAGGYKRGNRRPLLPPHHHYPLDVQIAVVG